MEPFVSFCGFIVVFLVVYLTKENPAKSTNTISFLERFSWKFSDPPEVKATLREIINFLNKESYLSREILLFAAMKLAKDTEKTVYSIRTIKRKPDQLALLIIMDIIFQYLSSGYFHMYRGSLNITGHEMFDIFLAAQKIMVKNHFILQNDANRDSLLLAEQIKKVG